MKKTLLSLAVAVAGLFSTTANAQLADYSVAPDFTVTDLQGNQHNLYSYLDQGYTVYLDLFAVWCGPCWNYHQGHTLENIWQQAGPGGTDKIIVMGVEADPSTAESTIYGGGNSIGDWTQGITYIMANDDQIASLYQLAYYPTIYMISPNRLSVEIGQQTEQNLLGAMDESWVLGPITEADDAAALAYQGEELSVCGDLSTSVMIQNHGTNNLTSATIEVMNNGGSVASYNWTGNLASYETAVVNIGNASISADTGYIEITDADDDATNNTAGFKVTLVTEKEAPESVDMETIDANTGLPTNLFDLNGQASFIINKDAFGTPPAQDLGGYGTSYNSLFFYYFNAGAGTVDEYVTKRLDFTNVWNASMSIDRAYAQYSAENDMLQIDYSTDCGDTWTNVYTKSGSDLATAPATTGLFVPEANQWATDNIDISAVNNMSNVLFRIKGTSDYGNNIYVDNVNISGSVTSVQEATLIEGVKLFPNPAQNMATITVTAAETSVATVKVLDMAGRTIQVINANMVVGENKVILNTDEYTNGVYFVEVASNNQTVTERLVIQK